MIFFKLSRALVLCVLLCWSVGLTQTLGGTVISNQASSSYSVLGLDSSTTSNTVESSVPSVCSFAVTPNGSLASPARSVDAIPGATVYLPYTLNYTANVVTDIDVAALVTGSSTLLPSDVFIILDGNNNQRFDTGESSITTLENVAFSSSTSLLLAVTLEPSYSNVGTMDVNLRANCKGETIFDNDNVSRVNVLEGGVADFVKVSVPASGSQVMPGDAITYAVGFKVNQRVLENAIITDILDDALDTPNNLRVTINTTERTGVVTYNATTRTVTATLGTLSPNDEVVLTITANVLSTTPGGVTINNEATLSFTGGSLTTNRVTHSTPATCAVIIKDDGSIAEPVFIKNALPGDTVVYPYTLTNLGNVTNDFALETTLVLNEFIPILSIILDTNSNGLIDANELAITRVDDLPSNETVNLLLVVNVPDDLETTGDVFANIIGRCLSDPTILDDNNVSEVTVPNGGITSLQKSSDPAPGSILYSGAEVRYFIEFVANGRDLSDVVVWDVLDERFTVPSSFTTGEVHDDESGLTATVVGNYNETTHRLTWSFASVPAGMNVRLEFVTSVKADIQPQNGDEINNTAMFSSSDVSETPTNTVIHPLNQLEILLSKVATPEKVFVGDTLTYTLTMINPEDSIPLKELVLTDTLPIELRYQAGSARVKLPGLEEQALEPTIEGQKLTWTLPGLEPSEQALITIGTDVLASAAEVEELINTASLLARDFNSRVVATAAAAAAATIDKGVFAAPAVLLGTVFEDLNGNSFYEQDVDTPVSGVRLYLSDGRSVVSDELGRYTFLELQAGLDVVKVDETTLPARLLAEINTESRPGLWRVRLDEGLITRQDVPLLPPGSSLAVRQVLNVVMGSVRIQKSVVVSESVTRIILKVSSAEALQSLVIQDAVSDRVMLASQPVSDAANAKLDGLTFNLGDVSANYQTTIEYTVQSENISLSDLLLAPTITWEVRP